MLDSWDNDYNDGLYIVLDDTNVNFIKQPYRNDYICGAGYPDLIYYYS